MHINRAGRNLHERVKEQQGWDWVEVGCPDRWRNKLAMRQSRDVHASGQEATRGGRQHRQHEWGEYSHYYVTKAYRYVSFRW